MKRLLVIILFVTAACGSLSAQSGRKKAKYESAFVMSLGMSSRKEYLVYGFEFLKGAKIDYWFFAGGTGISTGSGYSSYYREENLPYMPGSMVTRRKDLVIIPLFAHVTYTVPSRKRVLPAMDMDAGYAFDTRRLGFGGFFCRSMFGFDFRGASYAYSGVSLSVKVGVGFIKNFYGTNRIYEIKFSLRY